MENYNWLERIDPNRGFIGINHKLEVAEGYGSRIWAASVDQNDRDSTNTELSNEELIEMADEMIRRWTEYRKRVLEIASGNKQEA